MKNKLVQLDGRGRVSLGGAGQYSYYLMEVDENDGTITLRPAIIRALSDTFADTRQILRQVDDEQR